MGEHPGSFAPRETLFIPTTDAPDVPLADTNASIS